MYKGQSLWIPLNTLTLSLPTLRWAEDRIPFFPVLHWVEDAWKHLNMNSRQNTKVIHSKPLLAESWMVVRGNKKAGGVLSYYFLSYHVFITNFNFAPREIERFMLGNERVKQVSLTIEIKSKQYFIWSEKTGC